MCIIFRRQFCRFSNLQSSDTMPLGNDVVALLNGQLYSNNETGETEIDVTAYRIPIRTTCPDSGGTHLFLDDIQDTNSTLRAPIVLNELQTSTFLTDQVVYLREDCNIAAGDMPNAALCEIAYLRLLSYRLRVINGNLNLANLFVRYNNAVVSDPAVPNSLTNLLEANANRDAHRQMIRDWTNANQAQVQFIVANFSNIVCCVAYVFRQKGHHYITGPDYQEAYTKIWNKANRSNKILNATWEQMATIGLHAIMPWVLDQYYMFASATGRIAAPLSLRVRVPCAGTAAPFALLVGWDDAKSAYGMLLSDHEDTYERLVQVVQYYRGHRWAHGINSGYYGKPCTRLDLTPFSSMAATVAGVYEAAAERVPYSLKVFNVKLVVLHSRRTLHS